MLSRRLPQLSRAGARALSSKKPPAKVPGTNLPAPGVYMVLDSQKGGADMVPFLQKMGVEQQQSHAALLASRAAYNRKAATGHLWLCGAVSILVLSGSAVFFDMAFRDSINNSRRHAHKLEVIKMNHEMAMEKIRARSGQKTDRDDP